MIDQVHNETCKFTATWLNGASLALAGGGVALPLINYYAGKPDNPWPNTFLLLVCGCVALGLHYLGKWVLKDLQSA